MPVSPRAALRWIWAQGLEWVGANRWARRRLDGSRAAVLMYHRVLPVADAARHSVLPDMFVSPEAFERQMQWLSSRFRVLPLASLVEALDSGKSLPQRALALTFDDGWRDNFVHALPVLRRLGLPATVFVVTARVGTQGAFWPEEVGRRLAPLAPEEQRRIAESLGAECLSDPLAALLAHLNAEPERSRPALLDSLRAATSPPAPLTRELLDWGELDELAVSGVTVESHGATHAILTGLEPEAVECELRESRETLQAHGHGRHDLLAYPIGAYSAEIWKIAQRLGYRAAVTAEHGIVSSESDLGSLPRLGVHSGISGSEAEFHRKVPGWA